MICSKGSALGRIRDRINFRDRFPADNVECVNEIQRERIPIFNVLSQACREDCGFLQLPRQGSTHLEGSEEVSRAVAKPVQNPLTGQFPAEL